MFESKLFSGPSLAKRCARSFSERGDGADNAGSLRAKKVRAWAALTLALVFVSGAPAQSAAVAADQPAATAQKPAPDRASDTSVAPAQGAKADAPSDKESAANGAASSGGSMPAPATKADAEHPAETMAAGEAPAKVETPANQPSPTDGKPAQNGTAGSLASVSAPPPAALTIREGDTLKISFPGAPNLDVTQQVRRDGRITLSLVGEVIASGLTPVALESELLQRYSSQLVSKEVMVTVLSSTFTIYVSGAVLRPGKLSADRPLTALDAIMEAGGFDMGKANTKAVLVIREENGILNNYKLNLKGVLEGKQGESFYLRPYDKVFVPEKVSWF